MPYPSPTLYPAPELYPSPSDDGDGGTSSAVTPALIDLSNLLRARTKQAGSGDELGIFDTSTRPTGDQAAGLIRTAAADVGASVGEVSQSLYPLLKSATLYRAAMLVELSYYPEQVASDKSAYRFYKAEYDRLMEILLGDGADGGAVADEALPSYGGFPETGIGMEWAW